MCLLSHGKGQMLYEQLAEMLDRVTNLPVQSNYPENAA